MYPQADSEPAAPCWLCGAAHTDAVHAAAAEALALDLHHRGFMPLPVSASMGVASSVVASSLRSNGFGPRVVDRSLARGPAVRGGAVSVWAHAWVAAAWALPDDTRTAVVRLLAARPDLRARFGTVYRVAADVGPAIADLLVRVPNPALAHIDWLRSRGFAPVGSLAVFGPVWTNLRALCRDAPGVVHALVATAREPSDPLVRVWTQAWFAAVGVQHTSLQAPEGAEWKNPALVARHALVRRPGLRNRVELVVCLEGAEAGAAILDQLAPR